MYRHIYIDGSKWLRSGRLGDSVTREVGILLPPGYDSKNKDRYPLVICLSGFGTTGNALATTYHAFEPPLHARLTQSMECGIMKKAIFVFPDCSTRYGGSQFINGVNAGAMQDFLLEGIIGFIDANYKTKPTPEFRTVIGRSSGGYGAIRALLDRPDRIGFAGALAPDCMFEHCYLPFFPAALDYWENNGGYAQFVSDPRRVVLKDHRYMLAMSLIGMASVYAPRENPDCYGALFSLPYDPQTGIFNAAVWEEWKTHDIDWCVKSINSETLAGLSTLRIRVGARDEYNMALSAQFLSLCLRESGMKFELRSFDGYHGGNASVLIEMISDLLVDA